MNAVIDVEGREHFEEVVIGAGAPCVVDFWAPGCNPCRFMESDFLEAAKEFTGKVNFVRVNIETNQEIAEIMRIRSVPTLVAFRGPSVFDIRAGRSSKKSILRMAQRVLDKENGVGLFERIKRIFI